MSHPYFQTILFFFTGNGITTIFLVLYFLFSALTAVPICQWFLTGEGASGLYGKGGSVHCFHVTPPGRLWYGEGRLPDVRVFLIRPPGQRVVELLCQLRLTRSGRAFARSLRRHRISPTLRAPGKSGRIRNTRTSGRQPSPYHNLPGG